MWHDITHVTVSHHTANLPALYKAGMMNFNISFMTFRMECCENQYGLVQNSCWNVVKKHYEIQRLHWSITVFFFHPESYWILVFFNMKNTEKITKKKLRKLWIILYHLPRHIIFGFVLIIETQTFYSVSLAMVQWHEIFYGTKSDIGRQSQRTIGAWVRT